MSLLSRIRSIFNPPTQETMKLTSLFCGNIPFSIKNMPSELEDMFKKVGEVKSFTLINEKGTGKFKGIAFVEMSEADAKRAISNIHNAEIKGRRLVVKEANPRAER